MEPLRIVVVDDEPAHRELIGGFLRKQGHEVFLAASGPEALTHVKDHQVDLVLSDCRMPGMTGPELLLGIKAVNPEIPLILMTAYGTVETAVQAMKDGAADYLTKPLDLEELLLRLGRVTAHLRLKSEVRDLQAQLVERHRLEGIIGEGGGTAQSFRVRAPDTSNMSTDSAACAVTVQATDSAVLNTRFAGVGTVRVSPYWTRLVGTGTAPYTTLAPNSPSLWLGNTNPTYMPALHPILEDSTWQMSVVSGVNGPFGNDSSVLRLRRTVNFVAGLTPNYQCLYEIQPLANSAADMGMVYIRITRRVKDFVSGSLPDQRQQILAHIRRDRRRNPKL